MIAALLFMAIGGGSVLAEVTSDSTTWEGSYEADAIPAPTDPIWIPFGTNLATLGSIVADPDYAGNNYLSMPSGNYDGVGSWNFVGDAETNGGASFEFRCRVVSGSPILGHIMTTTPSSVANGGHYYWLTYYITDNDVEIYNTNGWEDGQADRTLDTSMWHTYRFVMDGTTWRLHIDWNTEEPLEIPATPWTDDITESGYSGYFSWVVNGGGADLDYMRYTDAGVFIGFPPPPVCGYNGYKDSDFNTDCYVNLEDLAILASEWLTCTDPAVAACDQYWK